MADDDAEEDDPLGDLAAQVRSRRTGADTFADDADSRFGLEEYFQEESYEAIDTDALWDALEVDPEPEPGIEAGDERDEHVVSKRSYCELCEHFSEPPEIACTYPGTTIVEFDDINHVRVRNCPVVAERETMGEEEGGPMTPGSFGSQGQ